VISLFFPSCQRTFEASHTPSSGGEPKSASRRYPGERSPVPAPRRINFRILNL
jgi:hypothetical protein